MAHNQFGFHDHRTKSSILNAIPAMQSSTTSDVTAVASALALLLNDVFQHGNAARSSAKRMALVLVDQMPDDITESIQQQQVH